MSTICSASITNKTFESIGANNIIHPNVTIKGKLSIGSNNIFEENCIIENTRNETLLIGNNNRFQVGSSNFTNLLNVKYKSI